MTSCRDSLCVEKHLGTKSADSSIRLGASEDRNGNGTMKKKVNRGKFHRIISPTMEMDIAISYKVPWCVLYLECPQLYNIVQMVGFTVHGCRESMY